MALGVLPTNLPRPALLLVRRLAITAGIRAVAQPGPAAVTVCLGLPGLHEANRPDLASLHIRRRPWFNASTGRYYMAIGDGVPGSSLRADIAVVAQLVNDPECFEHWPIDLDACVGCLAPGTALDADLIAWCESCWAASGRQVA